MNQTSSTSKPVKRAGWLLALFGIVIPAVTLVTEIITSMCTDTFFNPIPTGWHIGLITLVICTNGSLWLFSRQNKIATLSPRSQFWLGALNAFAIGVASIYTLLFSPLILLSIIAILFYGLGLLPLSPLFALLAACRLRWYWQRQQTHKKRAHWQLLWGAIIGIVALIGAELPFVLTHLGMQWAVSTDAATAQRGIAWLRGIGHKDTMLRASYDRPPGSITELTDILPHKYFISKQQAQKIYFRATGQSFNSVPPPRQTQHFWRQGFDDNLGGDKVAGQVGGLALISSHLEGRIDTDSATAYMEWTLEFKNNSNTHQEARTQIQIPQEGVVSRLTLWVNGEEREAAFASRKKVRDAYQQVAVRQQRDPVLVTSAGTDRVLVQCFPVLRRGGTMKIRLGITAPLIITDLSHAYLQLPLLLEQNFSIKTDFKHQINIESTAELQRKTASFLFSDYDIALPQGSRWILQSELSPQELQSPFATLESFPTNLPNTISTPALDNNWVITQTLNNPVGTVPDRVVIVIDSSSSMTAVLPQIADVLDTIPAGTEIRVLLGSDQPSNPLASPANTLRKTRAFGGQNNIPALEQALDLAASGNNGVILWIHGPQPELVDDITPLQQRFAQHSNTVTLYDLSTELAPNRIIEKLEHTEVRSVLRRGTIAEDLTHWFTRLLQPNIPHWQFSRVRHALADLAESENLSYKNRHIERLWALDQIRLLRQQNQVDAAVQLAIQQQLVTPVSGAVVLETQQQYEQNNLKPVDPNTVPKISEPAPWTLFLFGFFIIWLRKKRDTINLWFSHCQYFQWK